MLRRYELTDQEWNRIKDLLPPEKSGKRGRPSKVSVLQMSKVPITFVISITEILY